MLAARTATLIDSAAVACLRLELYTTLDRSDRGVELCLEYLRRIGVQWSPHPTKEEVRTEYDEIWRRIGSGSVESPGRPAADAATRSGAPPWMSSPRSSRRPCLRTTTCSAWSLCRMANISLEHGNSGASCFAYVWLGMILGPHFDDYPTGSASASSDSSWSSGATWIASRPVSTCPLATLSIRGRSTCAPAGRWCGAPSPPPTRSATSPSPLTAVII